MVRMVRRTRHVPFSFALMILGVGLLAWAFAAPRAGALGNGIMLLSGGTIVGEGATNWTAPGLANIYTTDFPAVGQGERAAQIRMPSGELRTLSVRTTTATTPTSGAFTLMVRINNADTALTCQVTGTGQCVFNGASVPVATGDRLAIRTSNDFVGSGNIAFTYTLLFD